MTCWAEGSRAIEARQGAARLRRAKFQRQEFERWQLMGQLSWMEAALKDSPPGAIIPTGIHLKRRFEPILRRLGL